MAYNPNIPQPTDLISVSQSAILNNFTSLGNMLAPNLAAISYPAASLGVPGTVNNVISVYSTPCALTGGMNNELWVQKTSMTGVTTGPIPISAALAGGNGWAYLPSGILLKWGSQGGLVPNTPGNTITFPVNVLTIPAFKTILSISVTPIGVGGNTGSIFVSGINILNCPLWITGDGLTACYYLAIGT